MQAIAVAKINAFLKITGVRKNYHEIVSRFIRLPNLYDTITFRPCKEQKEFILEGLFDCTTKQNTIYKAYNKLKEIDNTNKIDNFFKVHKVSVEKNIPTFAGLGGGSSDAATFLKMCNDYIKLNLDIKTLAKISSSVGLDVPFFIYDYAVANVLGAGEVVKPFEEEALTFTTITPKINCSTASVFKNYRKSFFNPIINREKKDFLKLKTLDALETLSINEANDLYLPAKDIYTTLEDYEKENYFFSGSGSTFFTIKRR